MAEEVTNQDPQQDTQQDPQLNEQQRVEQEAIQRYQESKKSEEERTQGVPEGYNEDGTPREELIGGKFKSQEDLLAAYQELEKKMGQPKDEPEEQPAEVETPSGKTIDTAKYGEEFLKDGRLSEKSYKELEGYGFSKAEVDRYIAGQQAYATQFTSDIYDTVGGIDNYSQIVTWAADNIDRSVIDEYNKALGDVDTATAKKNLEYMYFKMQQEQPKQARRIEGQSAGDGGMQPYASKLEWQTAQSNRLYGKDAKYTNLVDQRYLASRRKGLI